MTNKFFSYFLKQTVEIDYRWDLEEVIVVIIVPAGFHGVASGPDPEEVEDYDPGLQVEIDVQGVEVHHHMSGDVPHARLKLGVVRIYISDAHIHKIFSASNLTIKPLWRVFGWGTCRRRRGIWSCSTGYPPHVRMAEGPWTTPKYKLWIKRAG